MSCGLGVIKKQNCSAFMKNLAHDAVCASEWKEVDVIEVITPEYVSVCNCNECSGSLYCCLSTKQSVTELFFARDWNCRQGRRQLHLLNHDFMV